ncbi:hypothetical protein [Cellvibrio polysaccharolyticus]|nr:hypothetical protein [Cellvibrio polysaccharolyticus]
MYHPPFTMCFSLRLMSVVLFFGLAAPVFAETENAASSTTAQAQPVQQDAEKADDQPAKKKGSRLRFRDGPVCMCADGLTENDIMASQKRNSKKLEALQKN